MDSQAKLIALVVAVAIAAGAALGLGSRGERPQAAFVALDGENFTLADRHGRVVLVNFRATSCAPCVALDVGGEATRAFGHVSVTPTTYLLDRHGRIVTRYFGEPDWKEFHALVERALAG